MKKGAPRGAFALHTPQRGVHAAEAAQFSGTFLPSL